MILLPKNTVWDFHKWNKPHKDRNINSHLGLNFTQFILFPLVCPVSPQVLTALSLFLLPTDNDSTLEWKSNSYLTQSRRNYWNVFNGWWLTRICCNSFCTIILCALVTEIWWQEPVSILLTLGWIDKCPTNRLSLLFLLDLRVDGQWLKQKIYSYFCKCFRWI